MVPLQGGASVWQNPLIRQAPSAAFPLHQPPPNEVYTPTPDGFERFLRVCVGLSRDENDRLGC
jgi:hypothetical protein